MLRFTPKIKLTHAQGSKRLAFSIGKFRKLQNDVNRLEVSVSSLNDKFKNIKQNAHDFDEESDAMEQIMMEMIRDDLRGEITQLHVAAVNELKKQNKADIATVLQAHMREQEAQNKAARSNTGDLAKLGRGLAFMVVTTGVGIGILSVLMCTY